MSLLLDGAAYVAVLSAVSFGLGGILAVPLLMRLAARHGLPRRFGLVGLIPFLGPPLLFHRILRAAGRT